MNGNLCSILLAASVGWFALSTAVQAQNMNAPPASSKEDAGAVDSYRKAAEAGDGRAMEILGTMYAAGRGGLPKDDVQALYWYRKGADAGDAFAMTNLGSMYLNGRGGLTKDEAQAANWYRKAAEASDGLGMSNLGSMYLNGRGGLPKDDSQAANWFRKAAAAGDGSGMAKLGFMYAAGLGGLPKDSIQAVIWLHKAETAGDATIIPAVEKTLTTLETQSILGCMGRDKLSNQLTPVDLYNTMAACIGQENYDDALFFFMVAGAYGRFDALRVKDVSAHGVLNPLPEIFIAIGAGRGNGNQNPTNTKGSVFKTKESIFKERIQQLNGNAAVRVKYCSDIEGISPPAYFPFYMINHGAGLSKMGVPTGEDPLVAPFDAAKAWKQAVSEYLVCPANAVATPHP
jgi:TPR repeat protein